MQRTSTPDRWWDWASIGLLFLVLETIAARLVATSWTPFLSMAQAATSLSFVVGTALGYSRFSRRLSQWLSVFYLILLLPLQWITAIDERVVLEEKLISVAGRLYFSLAAFLARRPVEDPLFFVIVMTLVFWILSSWAAFTLVRSQNYLGAVLPSAIGLLIIQNYDHANPSRLWFMAFFAFTSLLLLGRLNFLQNRLSWRERRIFISPDNSVELTSSMVVAAGLLIIISWTVPASLTSWNSAAQAWNRMTKPWRTFTDNMQNAVSALKSPSGSRRGEFFGSELPLGRGFPLSDQVMFRVEAPELASDQRPPRYYWRGRSYDYFMYGQWYSTGTTREESSPTGVNPFNLDTEGKKPARFLFSAGDETFSLLYAPSQPIWISRPGLTFTHPTETGEDLAAWHAWPWLKPGETYQVDAILSNPNRQQLEESSTEYPEWVKSAYLELPPTFSPRIVQLAKDITATAVTPFDKATAITNYLRDNIEYAPTVPNPPRNRDPLEWFIFDYKKGFCVYYASSEVLMLRSLGIPARLAVGFAEGDRVGNIYTVRRLHGHAWPEVYFPGIGWIEFEPTASQPVLDRPLPPQDSNAVTPINPFTDQQNARDGFEGRNLNDPDLLDSATPATGPALPLYYLIPSLTLLMAALIYLVNRRYPLAVHVPTAMRATLERSGFEVPRWIVHWESWGGLSPVEKAFESVNFGLRTLDGAVPVHTTPSERADHLSALLPQMSTQIKVLLDEHQTSLYTSRVADVVQARRAAFDIRKQVIWERIRYLFAGKPPRD